MKKIGLVLAGGGGKGAYQAGVWKAIKEYGLDKHIGAISGTSIGTINACMFVEHDVDYIENIWTNEITKRISSMSKKNYVMIIDKILSAFKIKIPEILKHGQFSKEEFLYLVGDNIDFSFISKSDIDIYATCKRIKPKAYKYFKLNGNGLERIRNILFATSAIIKVFETAIIDGEKYVDGAMGIDGVNVPIIPIYELGFENIIVVHLTRHERLNIKKYKNSKLYQVVPSKYLGGAFTGILDFSLAGIKRRIELGYKDGKRTLEDLYKSFL